jgi:hypothetical protein
MNPNYFTEIKKQTALLDLQFPGGDCLVSSLPQHGKGTADRVCEVPNSIGAKLLIEATHRLASDEETRAYRETQILQQATSTDPIAQFRQKLDLLTGGSN